MIIPYGDAFHNFEYNHHTTASFPYDHPDTGYGYKYHESSFYLHALAVFQSRPC